MPILAHMLRLVDPIRIDITMLKSELGVLSRKILV